jgi:phosphoglucomutase
MGRARQPRREAAKRPRSEPKASEGGSLRRLAAKRPRSEPKASEGGPPQSEAAIRFGTSGWRGVLGEDFTLPRLRRVLAAVGRWLQEQGTPGEVIVAHDTRPLGDRMARLAAAALRRHGQRPLLAKGAVPTPVIARAIRRRRARAGLVFTASHNPPEYHGLKLLGASGGSLAPAPIRRVEALLGEEAGEPRSAAAARARRLDLAAAYLEDLLALIERGPIARARLRVVYDAMHGAGAPVLASALRRSGARVHLLRGRPDPRFGGQAPDPIPERLGGLVRALRGARGLALGLATDGDADRFTAVDAGGRVLSPTQAVALLVDHLARSGRIQRGLALSVATGSLVEKIARTHGLAVTRHPIGFRLLSERLAAGAADAAADESGGFALGSFSADKDGILAGCLLAELMASQRAPLRARLAELERCHGRSACGRTAHPLRPRSAEALRRLCAAPPSRVARQRVREAESGDGLRLVFDDGFLFLRASGTEPVLRIYAEARSRRELLARLTAGALLLAR